MRDLDPLRPRRQEQAALVVRHGDPADAEVDLETWLGPDPALALVHADLDAWLEAHPCACEYLCECDL